MTRPAWVIMEGTKPIGIALSQDALHWWLDRYRAACGVRVEFPTIPEDCLRDDFDPDDLDPDEPDEYP